MKRFGPMLGMLLCAAAVAADTKEDRTEGALVRIERAEVVSTSLGNAVLLRVQNKAIPIFVDPVVAQSIHGALTGEKFARPLTHDLMRSVLENFDGKVSRVVITLKGSTYYGALTVVVRGTAKVFDSRSSDAIALAIHFNAPMLVSQEVVDKAGKSVASPVEAKPRGQRL